MKFKDILNYIECINIIFNTSEGIESFYFIPDNFKKFEKYLDYKVIKLYPVARNNAAPGTLEVLCERP